MTAKVQTTLRFEPQIRSRMDKEAERRGISLTALIELGVDRLIAEGEAHSEASGNHVVSLPRKCAKEIERMERFVLNSEPATVKKLLDVVDLLEAGHPQPPQAGGRSQKRAK